MLTAGNKPGTKLPSVLEKIQPFTRGDILQKKGKQKKKVMLGERREGERREGGGVEKGRGDKEGG
jgi:hypothetical protein